MLAGRLQEHALRSAGVFPAVLEPPPEPEPAAGADGEERQLVPGTHWAIQFDEDGEVRRRPPRNQRGLFASLRRACADGVCGHALGASGV